MEIKFYIFSDPLLFLIFYIFSVNNFFFDFLGDITMAKKLTLKEWNEKFLSEFSTQIDDFRHDTNKLLFRRITVTDEIKHQLNIIRKGIYSIKMEINELEDYGNRTEFTLTDYNGVQLFITEYYIGKLSIGVCDKRKIVLGHVIEMCDDNMPQLIDMYFDLFKATMSARDAINNITSLAGTRNI